MLAVLSSSKTAEQLTLAEAVELIVYGASCNRCHETRSVDLTQLRDRLGPHFLVGERSRPGLFCTRLHICGDMTMSEQLAEQTLRVGGMSAFRSRIPMHPWAATGLAVVLAMAYHGPYWASFDVNILEYATLPDIIRLGAEPIGLIATIYLLSFLTAPVARRLLESGAFGGGSTIAARRAALARGGNLVLALINFGAAIFLILGWIFDWPQRHMLSMIMLGSLIISVAQPSVAWVFPRAPAMARTIIALVVFVLPMVAVGKAWTDAEAIRDGVRYMEFRSFDSSGWSTTVPGGEAPRYLGRTADTILLYQPAADSVLILPASSVVAYTLKEIRVPLGFSRDDVARKSGK